MRMRAGTELLGAGAPDPWWRDAVPGLRRTAEGLRFEAPVVDMSLHLPWLCARLRALGGAIERHHVAALDELDADAVVNCAGLGARELAGDASLTAVRGQVVRVRAPAVQEWLLDQSDPERLVYVVPREHDVVLGGTAQEGDEDRTADPATTAAVRAALRRARPRPARRAGRSAWPWGCGRCARRCAWRPRGASCTATATAARA